MKNRFHTLDYLRGFAALSIMFYHYGHFIHGDFGANSILGRLGVYGVSIFYILSGLTLYLVYQKKMKPSINDVKEFAMKRIFRIFPLMWLVTVITLVLRRQIPDWKVLLLNLSGLFGFIQWDAYIGMGMWSIGNELVFYVFFILFIYLIKKTSNWFWILSASLLCIYCYFAFSLLQPSISLADQWLNYINPMNQAFLFCSGVAMGVLFKKSHFSQTAVLFAGIIACAIFTLFPADGNTITLVTGWNRLIFTALVFLICFCFFKLELKMPQLIHKPLTILGEASYSVYLVHPLVWIAMETGLSILKISLPVAIKFIVAVVITIEVSYAVYIHFEKYFIAQGRKASNKLLGKNRVEITLHQGKVA